MAKAYHVQCRASVKVDGAPSFQGKASFDGICNHCQQPFGVGDSIAYYKEAKPMPSSHMKGASGDAPGIDWEEANRFDQWVKEHTPVLRRIVFELKERHPHMKLSRPMAIISDIYRCYGNVPLNEDRILAERSLA